MQYKDNMYSSFSLQCKCILSTARSAIFALVYKAKVSWNTLKQSKVILKVQFKSQSHVKKFNLRTLLKSKSKFCPLTRLYYMPCSLFHTLSYSGSKLMVAQAYSELVTQ